MPVKDPLGILSSSQQNKPQQEENADPLGILKKNDGLEKPGKEYAKPSPTPLPSPEKSKSLEEQFPLLTEKIKINQPGDIMTGQQRQQMAAQKIKSDRQQEYIDKVIPVKAKAEKKKAQDASLHPEQGEQFNPIDFTLKDIADYSGGKSMQPLLDQNAPQKDKFNSLNQFFGNDASNATSYFEHRLSDVDNQIKNIQQNPALWRNLNQGKSDLQQINNLKDYKLKLAAAARKVATNYTAWLYPDASLEEKGNIVRKLSGDNSVYDEIAFKDKGIPLTDEQKFNNAKQGIDVEREALESNYSGIPPQDRDENYFTRLAQLNDSDAKLINQFPDYKKGQIGMMISQLASTDKKIDVSNRLGLSQPELDKRTVDYISSKYNIPKEDLKGITYGDIPKESIWGNIEKGVVNLGAGLLTGATRILGSATGVDDDRLSYINKKISGAGDYIFGSNPYEKTSHPETIIDINQNSPTYLQNIPNPKAGKTNYNFTSVSQAMASGAADFAAFIGGLRLATKGVQAAEWALMKPLTAEAEQSAAMASYMILSNYENNWQKANQVLGKDASEVGKATLATLSGYIDKLAFDVLPKDKLFLTSQTKEALNKELSPYLKNLTIKDINKNVLQTKIEKAIGGIVNTAKEVGHITAATSAAEIAKGITNAIVGEEGKGREYMNEAWQGVKHNIVETPLSMALPLGLMEVAKMRQNSGFFKENVYNAGLDPNKYMALIHQELAKGNISPEEANSRIDVVKTMHNIVQSTPDINPKTGEKFTHNQQVEYAYNRLKESALRAKALELVDDPSISSVYLEDAQKLADERKKMLEQPEAELPKQEEKVEEPTFTEVSEFIPSQDLKSTEDVMNKVNDEEYINQNELEKTRTTLYTALDKHPEAAHLIEPLIQKLESHAYTTETKTVETVEKQPIEGTLAAKRKIEIKPALEQSEGSQTTVTLADGTEHSGKLAIRDGNYVVEVEGQEPVVVGEKAITDRDLKAPEGEQPVALDENGNIQSVTFETRDGHRVKIEDPEKALDLGIQLNIEALGEIPDEAFDKAYQDVVKTEQIEVPVEKPTEILKAEEVTTEAKVEATKEEKKPTSKAAKFVSKHITGEPEGAVPTQTHTVETIDNADTTGFNDVQKKNIEDLKRVLKAITKLVGKETGKELKAVIHSTRESAAKAAYDATIKGGGTEAEARANMQNQGNRGWWSSTDGTIHLNMAEVASDTANHEGTHPILDAIAKINPGVIDKFHAQLEALPEGKEIIKSAKENYTKYDEKGNVINESEIKIEAITDYIAKVADGQIKIDKSNFEKVKDYIVNLLTKLGIATEKDIRSIDDLRKLAQTISEKFATGKEIETAVQENRQAEKPKFSKTKVEKMRENDVEKRVISGAKVSTRIPSAKGAPEDTHSSDKYIVGLESSRKGESNYINNALEVSKYPITKDISKSDISKLEKGLLPKSKGGTDADVQKAMKVADKIYDSFVRGVADNLLWLHDNFDSNLRDVSRRWYDGANVIAQDYAKKYDVSNEQASGVIAVLSPQMDWYKNVSLAQRVLDIVKNNSDFIFDQKMADKYVELSGKIIEFKNETPEEFAKRKEATINKAKEDVKNLMGKRLDADPLMFAKTLRTYDETYGDKSYDILSPNGDAIEKAKKLDGGLSSISWQGYGTINKAINIIKDGSADNISRQLGEMHKVRNFYNNISDPNSNNGDVTIDTHAVAAGLLKPLAGSDAEVISNLSGKSSAVTGSTGTYPAFADAYRLAAKERGLLPRQMQSITWEAVRGLFQDTWKTSKNKKLISDIWELNKNKTITDEQARTAVNYFAGGVETPSWARPDSYVTKEAKLADKSRELPTGGTMGGIGTAESGITGKPEAEMVQPVTEVEKITTEEQVKPFGVGFAPYRDTKVTTLEQDRQTRKSPEFKFYQKTIGDVANIIGVKLGGKMDTWGGYVDSKTGKPVQEVSNVMEATGTPSQMRLMAAVMGKVAPEMQNSILLGEYSADGKGIEHIISTGNFENANKALNFLKSNGLEYFSIDKKTGNVIILDVTNSQKENIDNFITQLNENGIQTEHTVQPVNAEFIYSDSYDGILSSEGSKIGEQNRRNLDAIIEKAGKEYEKIKQKYDKENKPGVSGEVGVGEKPVKVQPVEGGGEKETGASGVLQAPGIEGEGKEPPQFSKQKINWEESKEGKGDPTISARNPIVQEAAAKLKEGKITNEEYRAIASENSPIRPITRFFEPATEDRIKSALSEDKVDKVNIPVEDGREVGLRLDIPAYKNNNTWVVSIHEGTTNAGKAISYTNVAKIKDVNFGVEPKGALAIAAGVPKTTIGRMFGKWENIKGDTLESKGENAKKTIEDIVNDRNYVQVGMNPFRHSYFYDRSNDLGRPIKSADEVIQVGGLVYAKNPVYGEWTDAAYTVKGLLDAGQKPVQFSKVEKDKVSDMKDIIKEYVDAGFNLSEIKEAMQDEFGKHYKDVESTIEQAHQELTTTGIKNEVVQRERAEKGLEPIEVEAKRSFGDVFDNAKKMIADGDMNGLTLAAEVVKNPRPLKAEESAVLLIDRMRISREYDVKNNQLLEAQKNGEKDKADIIQSQLETLEEEMNLNDEAARKSGYEQGLGLAARRMLIAKDYSLATQMSRLKAANGGKEVPEQYKKQLEGLIKQLEEANKNLSKLETNSSAKEKQKELDKVKKSNEAPEQVKKEKLSIKDKIVNKWGKIMAAVQGKAAQVLFSKVAGITPEKQAKLEAISKDVNDLVKVYAKEGNTNLRSIIDNIHSDVSSAIPELTRQDIEDVVLGKYSKEVVKKPLTKEQIQAQANVRKVQTQIDLLKEDLKLKQRGALEKGMDYLHGWHRFSILSGIPSLGKIGTAALSRGIVTRAENLVGQALSKIPGVSKIAKKAAREGGFNLKAEAKAFATWFDKMTMEDIRETMKTGMSSIDYLYGKKEPMAGKVPEWMEFFGRMHSAMKLLPKRAEFFRSLEMRTEHALKNGKDVNDPMVQQELATAAYNDALRSIFMQDNIVTEVYTNAIKKLEKTHPELASALKFALPIVKVPTNYVAEASSYVPPIAALKALSTLIRGRKGMTPEQADYFMRAMKKGSIGTAVVFLGFMNPQAIGGYYTGKRKKDDLEAGDIELFGVKLPHFMLHTPLLEMLQVGATMRRAYDAKIGKGEEANKLTEGIPDVFKGLSKQVPFVGTGERISRAVEDKGNAAQKYLSSLGASLLEPQLMQNLAEWTDMQEGKVVKRKAETFGETLKEGIPGLRRTLKEDKSQYTSKEYEAFSKVTEKGVNIPDINRKDAYRIKADEKHINGTMTPDEYDKFIPLVKKYSKEKISQVYNDNSNDFAELKKMIDKKSELTKDKLKIKELKKQLQSKINSAHNQAVETAKKDLNLID